MRERPPLADELREKLDDSSELTHPRARAFYALGYIQSAADDDVAEALEVLSDEMKDL